MLSPEEEKQQKDIIVKELAQFDITTGQKFNRDTLLAALDKKLGKRIERSIAEQLVGKLEFDEEGKITVEQVSTVIIEAEASIISKIQISRQFKAEYLKKREEVIKKREKERAIEQRNEFNIMKGSQLLLRALECSFGEEETFVKVQCGLSAQKLVWGETFQFPIITATESISVGVFRISDEDPLGITHLALSQLRDQKLIEKQCDLGSLDGKSQKVGKIKLELHWIYSKVEFLDEVVTTWDGQIAQITEDISGYLADLTTILEPFPGLFHILKKVEQQQFQTQEQISSLDGSSSRRKPKSEGLQDHQEQEKQQLSQQKGKEQRNVSESSGLNVHQVCNDIILQGI